MQTKPTLLERLAQGPVVHAEGFLFELERRGYIRAGEYVPEVALTHPDALENLHREFQRAGATIVEAFTYNSHREKWRVIDKEHLYEETNRSALRIAKKVANSNPSGIPDFMAGNISNTNIWDDKDPKSQDEVYAIFDEMVGWAKQEGADFIIGETFYYTGEALCALDVIKKHGMTAVITISPMGENKMRDGDDPVDAIVKIKDAGADVVGFNCFRGPQTMMPYLREMVKRVPPPYGAWPVPYRTTEDHSTIFNLPDNNNCACPSPHGQPFPTALDPLYCNRYEIREFIREVHYDLGINLVGVCCGNNPMLTREVTETVGLTCEASQYSENMANHFMYGDNDRIPEHMKAYATKA